MYFKSLMEADATMAREEAMNAAAHLDIVKQSRELDFLPIEATTEQKVCEYINKHKPIRLLATRLK